jgi:transmembrane sensor
MKHEILPELLKKYLRGEATPEESVLIDEWYSSLQENPDDIRLLDPLELDIVESRILDKVKGNISHQIPTGITHHHNTSQVYFLRTPFKLAAAIAAIAVIGLGAILFKQKGLPSLQNQTIARSVIIKKLSNETSAVKKVQLEDGTIINLQPKSSVEFPEKFSASERTVVLRGEAFFDVAKEKSRPFLISASDLTVKVLGTSFNVIAYDGAQQISVVVKTGKVSVSAKAKTKIPHQKRKQEEVILTPNQEAVYNTAEESLSKKLVDQPQIVLAKPTLFETQYDGAPVVKILNVLEKNYGIDIEFDEEAMANCILTTSMAEEGLYERIEIICKAIGAQYQINDTNIVIESNGCH